MRSIKWTGFVVLLVLGVILGILKKESENAPVLKTSRLLVNVQSSASFTPQEFADASSARLVQVDPRNPFKAILLIFTDSPFIVIIPPIDEKMLSSVAKKFGYRYLSISKGTLNDAVDQSKQDIASIPKFSSQIHSLDKEKGKKLYDLMKEVDSVFKDNHISYWATAGTLLGTVRHKGLIPWDDDLDIAIMDTDEKKLLQIQHALDQVGLEIHHYSKDFYKIYKKNGDLIPDSGNPGQVQPYRYPFVDVFVMTLEKNKEHEDLYVHKSKLFYNIFNNERFTYSQIAKLSSAPFGPMSIPIPTDPDAFLNQAYGLPTYPTIWKKYAIEPGWNHQTERVSDLRGAAFIEIDDYSPAPY